MRAYEEIISDISWGDDLYNLPKEERELVLSTEIDKYAPKLNTALKNGISPRDACGYICELFHERLIQDETEMALYKIADPNDEVKEAPFDIYMSQTEKNPLIF